MGYLALHSNLYSKAIEYALPASVSFTPGFTIYYGKGYPYTNLVIESLEPIPEVTYYFSPTGNDANDGLSLGTPKKDIRDWINALNASGTYSKVKFILEQGVYQADICFGGSAPNFWLTAVCEDGFAVSSVELPASENPVWTKTAGQTHIWQYNRSGADPYPMYDALNPDKFGNNSSLRKVSDLAECELTPGSYVRSGGILYVHTFNSREPDANLVLGVTSVANLVLSDAGTYFFKNIKFFGGDDGDNKTDSSNEIKIYRKNCDLAYSHNDNGQEINLTHANSVIISEDCNTYHNHLDGFSYRTVNGVEINCTSNNDGHSGGGANNCSTGHNGSEIISMNCTFFLAENRNVHDVHEGTRRVLLNCAFGGVINQDDAYSSFNLGLGREGVNESVITTCENGVFLTGAVADVYIGEGSTLNLKGSLVRGFIDNHGTLNYL